MKVELEEYSNFPPAQEQPGWEYIENLRDGYVYVYGPASSVPMKVNVAYIDPKGNSRYVVLALEDFYGNRRTELVRPSQLLIVDEPNVEGDSIRAIDDDSKHVKAYDYCCRWQIPKEFVPKDNGLFSKTYNYERGKRNHLRWRRARVMGWFEDDFETWSRGMALPSYEYVEGEIPL